MGRQGTDKKIIRHWEILRRIPYHKPGKTVTDLNDELKNAGFEVNKRTLERDLVELSGCFGLVCNSVSKPYGWHWIEGRKSVFGEMELIDALSLVMAESILANCLPLPMIQRMKDRFDEAKAKLESLKTNPLSKWPKKFRYVSPALEMKPPTLFPQVLDAVQQALIREVQLEVDYLAFEAKTSKHLIMNPVSLIQRGAVSYLLASVQGYHAVRLFALHRFKSARLLSLSTVYNEDSTEEFFRSKGTEFGRGTEIVLQALLSRNLAMYLTETPLAEDQVLEPVGDSQWELKATVHDTWQLQFWIKSQGSQITLIEPLHLREKIASDLRQAAQNYALHTESGENPPHDA